MEGSRVTQLYVIKLLFVRRHTQTSARALTTSKQIWDRLETDFLHIDVTCQVTNLKNLLKTNMTENNDVDVFVQK